MQGVTINFIKCFGNIYSTEITRTAFFMCNTVNCTNSKTAKLHPNVTNWCLTSIHKLLNRIDKMCRNYSTACSRQNARCMLKSRSTANLQSSTVHENKQNSKTSKMIWLSQASRFCLTSTGLLWPTMPHTTQQCVWPTLFSLHQTRSCSQCI